MSSTPPPPPPPPPPPSGQTPPPYQPPPGAVPPGYQSYGLAPVAPAQGTNGLAVASLVLSLVNVIPCFWLFPIPAVLAVIFGFVSRGQMQKEGSDKGAGLAIAGLVIGILFLIISVVLWVYIVRNGNCVRDGSSFNCTSLDN